MTTAFIITMNLMMLIKFIANYLWALHGKTEIRQAKEKEIIIFDLCFYLTLFLWSSLILYVRLLA